jgi:ketosteroid isomerase-like protein
MRWDSPIFGASCWPVLLWLAACTIQPVPNGAAGVGGAAGGAGSAGSADAAMLVREEKAFEAATATHGAEGWVSYFNDSSASFRPGQLIQIGQEAERRAITTVLSDSTTRLEWKPTNSVMAQSGDLGYTYGYYRLRGRDAKGKVQAQTGAYVTIWRRLPDSGWKVAVDIGSPGPAPAGFFDSVSASAAR